MSASNGFKNDLYCFSCSEQIKSAARINSGFSSLESLKACYRCAFILNFTSETPQKQNKHLAGCKKEL